MSKRRSKQVFCAETLAEEIRLARRARAWEIASHGQFIPSPEDRIKHDALIGPMPPELAHLVQWPGA